VGQFEAITSFPDRRHAAPNNQLSGSEAAILSTRALHEEAAAANYCLDKVAAAMKVTLQTPPSTFRLQRLPDRMVWLQRIERGSGVVADESQKVTAQGSFSGNAHL
jgi:hypothetical protein